MGIEVAGITAEAAGPENRPRTRQTRHRISRRAVRAAGGRRAASNIAPTCLCLVESDLGRPDYGDPVEIRPGEVPVFWACGVTPQAVALESRPELMITHEPGIMFLTDLPREGERAS
jgi:uncharacterized protein YcsI (UPF0317 family)